MKATLETRGVQTGKLAPGIDSWVVWENSWGRTLRAESDALVFYFTEEAYYI